MRCPPATQPAHITLAALWRLLIPCLTNQEKYSRDDEDPKPWPLAALREPPSRGTQGFYPCADFAVYKKLLSRPVPIQFPDYCFLSRNYYNKVRLL